MDQVTIRFTANGPYVVQGPVRLIGSNGQEIPVEGVFALCRCGGSKTKPFCDGTHSEIGFLGAEAAVEAAEGKSES